LFRRSKLGESSFGAELTSEIQWGSCQSSFFRSEYQISISGLLPSFPGEGRVETKYILLPSTVTNGSRSDHRAELNATGFATCQAPFAKCE
jgi:hypothetical protein